MLVECEECKGRVSDSAAACPHCGAIAGDRDRQFPVEVFNVDMKISTMIFFLIKAAVAAIPAVIILYTAWTVLGGILAPLLHL